MTNESQKAAQAAMSDEQILDTGVKYAAGFAFDNDELLEFARAIIKAQAAQVPPGYALVPKRLTRAMQEVLQDEWEWPDLLAAAEAITEGEQQELERLGPIGAAPAAQPVQQEAQAAQPVADAEIKAAFVAPCGQEDGWLGVPGSWFIEGYKAGRAAPQAVEAGAVISLDLADAQMLLSWMGETFGNEEGVDWQDEDAAAVGDALSKAIENFKRMRAALASQDSKGAA